MSARMTAVDAQFYWMSAKVPSDEFMLYAFDGEPTDFERAVDDVRSRAQACQALTVRVEDGSPLTYPSWVPTVVEPERVTPPPPRRRQLAWLPGRRGRLADDQLDIRRAPWRLHLFAPVHDLPGGTGPGTVAVMQFAHALADGRSRLGAGRLAVRPGDSGARRGDVVAGLPALARRQCRSRPSQAGARYPRRAAAPPAGARPALSTNARPAGRALRAHTGAAPRAAGWPHRHRRGVGRGVRCALRPPGRRGRIAGGRGSDG